VDDLTPIMTGILSAAASTLNDENRSPGRVELTPGAVPAWDDCCSGQLYARIINVFPTAGKESPFPTPDTRQRGPADATCKIHAFGIHFGLGILRCAHTVNDQGAAPSAAQVTDNAVLMYADSRSLLAVLLCDVPSVKGVHQIKLGQWGPLGVDGGCMGGEWTAFVMINSCGCA
jgi:hypothetical protein